MEQIVQFLSICGWVRSNVDRAGLVGDARLTQDTSALLRDHSQQQTNDLGEQAQAVLDDGLR